MAESAPPSTKDFFISYNKADRAWAEWIAWHLEESGKYSVVIQAWDFEPTCNFVIEMDRAIQECARVIAVLSPDYLTSLFTKPEWAAYFAQDPTSEQRRIVSTRVRQCELKGLLAPIVYTDLVGETEDDAKAALLDGVKVGRRKPERAPSFPGRPLRAVASKPHFPGSLPEIWNVPHLRNPNFTEPGQHLADLRAALQSGKPAALTQAITGLGGLGKTQLATEYAYRHAADYAVVWWVRSEQPETLAADYAALAAKLDLPEKDAREQRAIIAAVREALRHWRDWLLIFDNANLPEEIRPFLPQSRAHVLITSRNPAWGGVASRVPVEKWLVEVAVEFLLKRTGQADAESAEVLARELDSLPLALEQACAYMERASTTLASYLHLFRKHRSELLKRAKPSTDYPDTVATTWELAFQRLEKESPAAAALLNLCAFLASDDIPRDMIIAGAEHLPAPLRETISDPLAFAEVVSAIHRYSLIEARDEKSLSIHRLVQAVIRDRLDEPDFKRWTEAAVNVVNDAFPDDSDDVRTWKECDRLLPHAISVAEFAESLGVGLKATGRLLNQVGMYSWGRAQYGKAKAMIERALRVAERIFGPDDPKVAIRANNLGGVLRALGDLPGAKAAYERALKIDENAYGSSDPKMAIRVSNLGGVMKALGDLVGAKAAYERALQIDEGVLGRDHPKVAIRINNLGSVLQGLEDLSGAKVAYERALKIFERAGPDHPNVATTVNNLGSVLQHLGDLPGAKAAYERAFTIFQSSLGDDHPNTRAARKNLVSLAS